MKRKSPQAITPVIFSAPKQRYLVERLVRHCDALDGTAVRVIEAPEPEGMGYPQVCNWAFLHTCREMAGKPFFWLEADSTPLRAGWLEAIASAWTEAQGYGKDILWTTDSQPPHDLCTGIGVYGGSVLDHLPDTPMTGEGFDGYIFRELHHLIHQTPLIQHSYANYAEGEARLWRHPQPRADAVIFHKDQYQDLITTTQP